MPDMPESPDPDDTASSMSALLARIRSHGDRAAFAALFRAYAPRLARFFGSAGADAARADELIQETMLRVWRGAATYDPARGTADTWVFRIARNVRVDLWHKERRPVIDPDDPVLVPALGPDAPPSPEDAAAHRQQGRRLHAALASLPDEQAEVLRRMYLHGHGPDAIAADLGLPVGTVKSRARLAFQRLRRTLDATEE